MQGVAKEEAALSKIRENMDAFKAKIRTRKAQEAAARGVFGKKFHLRLRELKGKSGESSLKVPRVHKLLQEKAREKVIERHFGSKRERFISKDEYKQTVNKLKKDLPWIRSYNKKQQVRRDLDFLKKLGKLK